MTLGIVRGKYTTVVSDVHPRNQAVRHEPFKKKATELVMYRRSPFDRIVCLQKFLNALGKVVWLEMIDAVAIAFQQINVLTVEQLINAL